MGPTEQRPEPKPGAAPSGKDCTSLKLGLVGSAGFIANLFFAAA